MSTEKPLLKKEIARVLGCSPSYVSAAVRAGGLRPYCTASEAVNWRQQNPQFTMRQAYPRKR